MISRFKYLNEWILNYILFGQVEGTKVDNLATPTIEGGDLNAIYTLKGFHLHIGKDTTKGKISHFILLNLNVDSSLR